MNGLLFVAQPTLDGWLEAGQADVTAEGLRLGDDAPLTLEPALRVLEVLEGADAAGLVGKVRTEASLRALGGEPYGDSLLVGDVVYTVEQGFVATVPLGEGMTAVSGRVAQVAPAPIGRMPSDGRR
jgi:hypothetical protein